MGICRIEWKWESSKPIKEKNNCRELFNRNRKKCILLNLCSIRNPRILQKDLLEDHYPVIRSPRRTVWVFWKRKCTPLLLKLIKILNNCSRNTGSIKKAVVLLDCTNKLNKWYKNSKWNKSSQSHHFDLRWTIDP